jgi:hypothetical protein
MKAGEYKIIPGMKREVSLMVDGREFTHQDAIVEAKNCYGVENGVALLAEQLVDGLREGNDRDLLGNPAEYVKACVARAMYGAYLAGAVLLAEMQDEEYGRLSDIFSRMPEAEYEGRIPDGPTPEIRLLRSLDEQAVVKKMILDTELMLQNLIDRGYGGNHVFCGDTNGFRFDLKT